MSDRCKKWTKLSAKKKKYRRCHFIMNEGNSSNGDASTNAIVQNQMATSMQKFCIDSNIMLNTARKCSITGNKKRNKNEKNRKAERLIKSPRMERKMKMESMCECLLKDFELCVTMVLNEAADLWQTKKRTCQAKWKSSLDLQRNKRLGLHPR